MGNQVSNQDIEVSKLSPVDVDFVFRSSGLMGNELSPFQYDSQRAAVTTPSQHFQAFRQSDLFRNAASILLEPDLKVSFSIGGSGSEEDSYFVLMKKEDPAALALMRDSAGDYLLLHFEQSTVFLHWWVNLYGMGSLGSYPEIFEDVQALEVLVYTFHAIDTYRRAYMESMLNYKKEISLSISSEDFLNSMQEAVANKDARWLLPTLFGLCPALSDVKLHILPEHVSEVENAGFVTLSKDENNSQVIVTLGEKAQSLGTEFLKTWMGSTAIEAFIMAEGGPKRVSTLFLAPTAFTNHVFSFRKTGEGCQFRHQATDRNELEEYLARYFRGWLGSENKEVSQETTKPAEAKGLFCGKCGQATKDTQRFCGQCGSPV